MEVALLDKQLAVHEAICAERYRHIIEKQDELFARLGKVEKGVIVMICALIALHPSTLQIITKIL
jgi:hypothetical protein